MLSLIHIFSSCNNKDFPLIDATQTVEKDLSEYDLIGFASGVYGGKFHQSVLKFASVNLTDNKRCV